MGQGYQFISEVGVILLELKLGKRKMRLGIVAILGGSIRYA